MADQDFDLKIRTTADTSGIRETEAELEKLKAQAGAAGGPGGAGVEGAAGTMAFSITAALAAGLEVHKTIVEIAQEQLRLNEELDQQVDSLGKASAKWREMAQNATSAKDVLQISKAVLPELNSISTKMAQIRKEELEGWAYLKDQIQGQLQIAAAAGISTGTPFEKRQQKQIEGFEELEKNAIKFANRSIDAGEKSAAAWDKLKAKPIGEAIAEITEKIRELKGEISEIDRSSLPGLTLHAQLKERLLTLEDQLKDRTAEQEKQTRKQVSEEEKRTRELEKQTQEINKQVAAKQAEFQQQIAAAGGSVTGALLAQQEQQRQAAIQQQRQEAEARDIQARVARGAYGQTELGGPAFKGGRPDFGPGAAKEKQPGDMTETNSILREILNIWR